MSHPMEWKMVIHLPFKHSQFKPRCIQQSIHNTQWDSDMNFQFLFTTKWGQPLFSIMRSSPALWFIWGFEIYFIACVWLLCFHQGSNPILVPLQSVLGHGFIVRSPCLLLFAESTQSLLMHLFKVHFKYRIFINCIALQSACRWLLITGNGFASYFAWPRSFLSVPLSFECSVFFGQLPLCSACNLMITAYFTLHSLRVGKVTTSLGLTLKEIF